MIDVGRSFRVLATLSAMLLRCEVEGGQDCEGGILSWFWSGHQEFRSSGTMRGKSLRSRSTIFDLSLVPDTKLAPAWPASTSRWVEPWRLRAALQDVYEASSREGPELLKR